MKSPPSCIFQQKKVNTYSELAGISVQTKNRKRKRERLRIQEGSWKRLWCFPRTKRGKKCSNEPQQWEEASENIRKQSASLPHCPLMWLEGTSYHHGYRKLVKDVIFFPLRTWGVGRGTRLNSRRRSVWLAVRWDGLAVSSDHFLIVSVLLIFVC